MTSAAFLTEMDRQQDPIPRTKVEFISTADVTTDITAYYINGANFEQIKERAPDEIQAGNFDIVLSNHDDYFSEFIATSLFYNAQYHGARIKVSQGFTLPDGTSEYEVQAVGYIDQLTTDPFISHVTLRCRDIIRKLLDQKLHQRPTTEVVDAAAANIGNGVCSTIETKPFKTKNENWTLTCTLGGADGVATFSVVGSVSGAVGTATSGTQFSTLTGAGGVKFTITAGGTGWAVGDIFTFSTKQYPEWSGVNAGKIIWAVLTGYNWDADTQEVWHAQVLSFDHTKSTANTALDYTAFASVISDLDTIGSFSLTGYAEYDASVVDFLQSLILLFLGSLFTAPDGRLSMNTYIPHFSGIAIRNFADSKQIKSLSYTRTEDEVINYVSVHYKKTNVWEFSDESIIYNGNYVNLNQDSIDKYDFLSEGFSSKWFSINGSHVQDFADKLVQKYADPPLNVEFSTGMDALLTKIGDPISVTDVKSGFSATFGEVAKITKNFDADPKDIAIRMRRDSDLNLTFCYLGSSANEGDGISPQALNYDSASATDLSFAYLGATGQALPDYRAF